MLRLPFRSLVNSKFGSRFSISRNASTFLNLLDSSIDSIPQREAVLYKTKTMKWTAAHFRELAAAHATALLDLSIKPGDRVAVWLADKAEKHIALLAAAHAGFVVVDVNQEEIVTVEDLRAFLRLANCKLLYFDLETTQISCTNLLRSAIPEYLYYDDKFAQPFHSKHFPTLKYFVHTGFDIQIGAMGYKNLFIPDPLDDGYVKAKALVTDDSPAYVKIFKGPQGWTAGPTLTQKQLIDSDAWLFAKNLVTKTYFVGY